MAQQETVKIQIKTVSQQAILFLAYRALLLSRIGRTTHGHDVAVK